MNPHPAPPSAASLPPHGRLLRRSLLLIAAACLPCSCVGVLPVPPKSREPIAGKRQTASALEGITPGVTTRAEIERRLGPCTHENPRSRSIAYTWETHGWTLYGWAASTHSAIIDRARLDGWHALLISFDAQNRVRKAERVKLSQRRSLDDQMVKWAAK